MPDCCSAGSSRYEDVFDDRFAHDVARRYRRRGLTAAERSIVDYVAGLGLTGRTVVEIGGGVGEIQVELLARGAAHTTNLELSGAYEREARALLAEHDLANRATRVIGVDLAADGDRVAQADYVVLHRVVCCYPDSARLLAAAAAHTRSALVFSHPPSTWFTRLSVGIGNASMGLRRREYRGYVHSPSVMYGALQRAGMQVRPLVTGLRWTVVAATPA